MELCDLELLADLQHYGAATCLIDFTQSPLTALWFACKDEDNLGKDGKVIGMRADNSRFISNSNGSKRQKERTFSTFFKEEGFMEMAAERYK